VADYLLGQYDNFLQFAGQKDGATRCSQIVQLLLANHVDYDVSDPFLCIQLDASNAFCSVARQPQFDVLAALLSKALSCAAKMKKILKADLDMDLNVPKFNVFFPNSSFSLETDRSALERAVREDPALADLAARKAGVSTDGMRVAGVLVGVDAWVKTFLAKKARSVITDVAKLDVVSDGLHNQLLHFCPNAHMSFLGRNTPTPLLSEFMAQVDDTIVETVCRHGTGGGHVDWSPHLRKFANMKIQMPHFRGGFGITPHEGSAISAFYCATCALVVWLGSHWGNRPAQDFADTWAPGLNLTSPDSWHAPLLQALSALHALLLQDYGCVQWTSESDRVPAPLAVSIAPPFVQPSVGSRNSPPPLSTVTLPQPALLFQSTHEDRQGAEALAEPGERFAKSPLQRTLTAHIMSRWAKHEGALVHISLKRSIEMLELQCAQPFPARPADPES